MSSAEGVEAVSTTQSRVKNPATGKLDQASAHRKFHIADNVRLEHAKYYEGASTTLMAEVSVVSCLEYNNIKISR